MAENHSQIADSLVLATAPGNREYSCLFISECKSWRSQGKSQLTKTWKSPRFAVGKLLQLGLSRTTHWTVVEGGLDTRPKTWARKASWPTHCSVSCNQPSGLLYSSGRKGLTSLLVSPHLSPDNLISRKARLHPPANQKRSQRHGQDTELLSQKATGLPYNTGRRQDLERLLRPPLLAARCCFLRCEVRSSVTKVFFCNLSEHILKAVEVKERVEKARKPLRLEIRRGENVLVLGTRHAPSSGKCHLGIFLRVYSWE